MVRRVAEVSLRTSTSRAVARRCRIVGPAVRWPVGDQRWAAESNQLTQGVLGEPSRPTKADEGSDRRRRTMPVE